MNIGTLLIIMLAIAILLTGFCINKLANHNRRRFKPPLGKDDIDFIDSEMDKLQKKQNLTEEDIEFMRQYQEEMEK